MRRTRASRDYEQLLAELHEERVAALTRIGKKLESLIEQVKAIASRLPGLAGDERARALMEHARLRAQAKKYRWYLEVQREALGLRQHHNLDEFYAIPESIEG
jgi:hypothetical protein